MVSNIISQPSEVFRPIYAWLTVNRRCNFRCQWCYAQGAKFSKDQEMTLDLAMVLTRILMETGINHLFITGGEPTLWKPLIQFNAFCQKVGLETTLVTNAMRFEDDKYWRDYLEKPNTYIGVSLKAGDSEQLYATAKVRSFDKVTRGIRRAMEHFQSGVGIVYNEHYVDSLVQMAEFAMVQCSAKSVKVDFCTPVFVEGEPVPTCVMDPNLLVTSIIRDFPEIERITSGQLSFIMSIPFCIWPKEFIQELKDKNLIESVCHLMRREGIVVGYDGSLYMCNELFDFPIGKYGKDFMNSESLIKFLNNPDVNEYYDEISRYPSARCQDCSWYLDCGGGCPLQWSVLDPEQYINPL